MAKIIIIGYSISDFFSKNSCGIFSTREDSIKNVKQNRFAGRCIWKKNDCRGE